jgi:Holliday junction DNA helicase RuvA
LIGRLTGRIVEDAEDGVLLVDVSGVGYEVTAPLGTRGRLGLDPTAIVTLFIHTHVREDALSLFGFASSYERETFRVLIGISNVGPKLALSVLSAVSVDELAQAVARGETSRLVAIPGVGKKTAERLLLELKGKLAPTGAPAQSAAAPAAPRGGKAEVVLATLTRMGFRPSEADRAVATLAQTRPLDDAELGELVREALAILSR